MTRIISSNSSFSSLFFFPLFQMHSFVIFFYFVNNEYGFNVLTLFVFIPNWSCSKMKEWMIRRWTSKKYVKRKIFLFRFIFLLKIKQMRWSISKKKYKLLRMRWLLLKYYTEFSFFVVERLRTSKNLHKRTFTSINVEVLHLF